MNNWPTAKIGSVLRRADRFEPRDELAQYRFAGTYSYARGIFPGERKEGSAFALPKIQRIRAGDFIYCKIMAWEGAFGVASRETDNCVMSGAFVVYEPDRNQVEEKFLDYYFKVPAHWQRIGGQSTGTNVRRQSLHPSQFERTEIPLPPMAEQRRIVARIEELATQVQQARTLRQQAAEEAEAVLRAASAKLFEPKPGWAMKAVGAFCEPPQYGFTASAVYEAIGPRFLRITDIQDGEVDWPSVPYCHCSNPTKYLLKPNDLVFARTGATTGKSFVIRDCPEAVFASYLIRLRLRDTVSVEYLYRYFQSPKYWKQVADEKKGTGQANLNGSKLSRLKVPIAPEAEQRRIVAELDALQAQVDALKGLQAETAHELDALLPAILDRAFKGEL